MLNKDEAIILLILDSIEKIFLFTSDIKDASGFEKDVKSFDATVNLPLLLLL